MLRGVGRPRSCGSLVSESQESVMRVYRSPLELDFLYIWNVNKGLDSIPVDNSGVFTCKRRDC